MKKSLFPFCFHTGFPFSIELGIMLYIPIKSENSSDEAPELHNVTVLGYFGVPSKWRLIKYE